MTTILSAVAIIALLWTTLSALPAGTSRPVCRFT